jgi:hypothetical protein
MEHVLSFMCDVHFRYCSKLEDIASKPPLERKLLRKSREEWVQTTAALLQTRKPCAEAKMAWLLFANKYMAADRMSPYADPHDRSRLMTHKKAAKRYRDEAAKLELELNRARNGRLRFWHH